MNFGRGWGLRNIVEPLNAAVLAMIPEKRPSSAALLAKSYTCNSSLGKGAATGENADAARLGCFAAPTASCGDGRVPGDGEQGGVFRGGRLAMNVILLADASHPRQRVCISIRGNSYMNDAKHRVIGIRHALRKLKDEGFVDDSTMYPDDAVDDVKDEMSNVARRAYWGGAKRGALEVIEAILNGDLEVIKERDGSIKVQANVNDLSWSRLVVVKAGNGKITVPQKTYKLDAKKDLGFA